MPARGQIAFRSGKIGLLGKGADRCKRAGTGVGFNIAISGSRCGWGNAERQPDAGHAGISTTMCQRGEGVQILDPVI